MQRIGNFILCDNVLLPSSLCMRKVHLYIRSHKRGLGLKKICVMNMSDLLHAYERGFILKVTLSATFLQG